MYGCLMVIFFLGIFLVLGVVSMVLNFFFGLWRTTQRLKTGAKASSENHTRQQDSWQGGTGSAYSNSASGTKKNAKGTKQNGKIFQQSEGEYVDFEEVKDE